MKLLRHDIRLILKGLREIGRLRRHLLSLSIITAALEAIYPFINIYMTGLIIGAIALKQGKHITGHIEKRMESPCRDRVELPLLFLYVPVRDLRVADSRAGDHPTEEADPSLHPLDKHE